VRRISVPIIATVVVALGLGLLVGGVTPATAVVVNGSSVPKSTVDQDLAAIKASPGYLCYLNAAALIRSGGQSGIRPVTGATKQTYGSGFVADWMNQEITNQIIRQAARSEGLGMPSQADLATAQSDLVGAMDATLGQVSGSSQYACSGNATAILNDMPVSFNLRQVEAQALSEALLVRTGGSSLDAASVQRYYDTHTADFDTYCVSAILVADTTVSAKVLEALAAGQSFASVAQQYSIDPSKSKGGDLGCFDPTNAAYQGVVKDAANLTIGQPSGPILSSNSQIVILMVTSRTATPFASIEGVVRRTVLAMDASSSQATAKRLINTASVSLNPLYGTWKRSGSLLGVAPPVTPPDAQMINPSANLPGATKN